MAEALKKKLRDRRYRTAFADAVLDDSIVLQIKTLRENRGFSQEELGRRAGMKQGAISRIESSDYGAWSVSTLKRIAKALDLPLSVRFVSWGNLLETAAHFTPAHLDVPPFDQDPAFLPVSDTTYVMDSNYLSTAIQRERRAFEHSLISEGWNQALHVSVDEFFTVSVTGGSRSLATGVQVGPQMPDATYRGFPVRLKEA